MYFERLLLLLLSLLAFSLVLTGQDLPAQPQLELSQQTQNNKVETLSTEGVPVGGPTQPKVDSSIIRSGTYVFAGLSQLIHATPLLKGVVYSIHYMIQVVLCLFVTILVSKADFMVWLFAISCQMLAVAIAGFDPKWNLASTDASLSVKWLLHGLDLMTMYVGIEICMAVFLIFLPSVEVRGSKEHFNFTRCLCEMLLRGLLVTLGPSIYMFSFVLSTATLIALFTKIIS